MPHTIGLCYIAHAIEIVCAKALRHKFSTRFIANFQFTTFKPNQNQLRPDTRSQLWILFGIHTTIQQLATHWHIEEHFRMKQTVRWTIGFDWLIGKRRRRRRRRRQQQRQQQSTKATAKGNTHTNSHKHITWTKQKYIEESSNRSKNQLQSVCNIENHLKCGLLDFFWIFSFITFFYSFFMNI